MHVQLKLVLDCPPDAAWNALRSPAVFGAVSFPLVEFTPLDGTRFPEQWDEGAHAVAARALFGTVPAGTQSIDLTFRRRGSWRIFEDHGGPLSGPLTLLTRWRHRMAVAVTADGRTLFRDRLEFSAPLATQAAGVDRALGVLAVAGSSSGPARARVRNTIRVSLAMTPLDVADWRRRVFALYAEVRAIADPAAAHARWCAVRNELFAHHAASPLLPEERAAFTGLPVATYDPEWRFELEVEPADATGFDYETGTDGVVGFERIGVVRIAGIGSLDVWKHLGYGGGLFVPVKDGLKGKPGGTYGGGRYLLDTIKGADLGSDPAANAIVVDLNFAYNPSCAYDPAWACPLAPVGNTVAADVPVGEMY